MRRLQWLAVGLAALVTIAIGLRDDGFLRYFKYSWGLFAAAFDPSGVVVPIGQHRRVKGGFVLCHGLGGAEEMPTHPGLGDGLQRQGLVGDGDRREIGLHHAQHLGVQDQLFKARGQPAMHPARAVDHQMRPAHQAAPK